MKRIFIIIAAAATMLAGCEKKESTASFIVRGADLGWLSEMERDSMTFRNEEGDAVDCIELFKATGMNAVRLRVWVNHKTGWSNLPDVLEMAKRVKAAELPLMIDFHYSDFFADPQRQDIPEAWQGMTPDELCKCVADHTTEVLTALKNNGIEPKWVQIGNETTYGMMWPDGKLDREQVNEDCQRPNGQISKEFRSDWAQYVHLSNAGYEAAKAVLPEVICIVHVDNAFIPRVNWYERFKAQGGKWDMIGLSHYPFTQDTLSWQEMNARCEQNVRDLYEVFGTPVMVVEIGSKTEELPEESAACLRDFNKRMEGMPGYEGVFYWEPEVYGYWRPAEYIPLGWNAYNMGCMTPDGHLSEAARILYEGLQ